MATIVTPPHFCKKDEQVSRYQGVSRWKSKRAATPFFSARPVNKRLRGCFFIYRAE